MFGSRLIKRERVRRIATSSNGGRSMLGLSWLGCWKRAKKAKLKKQACECTTCQCKTE